MKLLFKEFLASHRVSIYRERTRSLEKRGWLVEAFKRHLDAGSWPTSDKAEKQMMNIVRSVGKNELEVRMVVGHIVGL